MPVRKIPRNYRSVTGLVASSETARSTGYESTLERDFIKHLVFNKNVLEFEEQPLTIDFTDNGGKQRRYTPDLLVSYRKDTAITRDWRPLLVEIKHRSDLFEKWVELKPKFRAGRAYASEQELDFAVITDREIRTPYLKNITFLLEFRKYPVDEEINSLLLDAVNATASCTPARLLAHLCNNAMEKARMLPILWQLTANGRIDFEIEEPLTMNTPIWITDFSKRGERDESGGGIRTGLGHRKRGQALRYYPYSES